MITGVHALIYARDAEKARAFFRDVLDWPFVDAGHGWLIFALPPAEVGVHPTMPGDPESHQLFLMTDDVQAAVKKLEKLGFQCAPVVDQGFGLLTSFELPGGGAMGMYQPKHPIAAGKKKRPAKKNKSPERKRRVAAAPKKKAPAKKQAKKQAKKPSKKPPKKPARKKR